VLAVAALTHWFAERRPAWRDLLRLAAIAALAAAVCGVPLLIFALQHPDEFFLRTTQASVLGDVRSAGNLDPLFDSLRQHLLMFNLAGDRTGRHNVPGAPELNPLLAALFVLGLGLSLFRWRGPAYLLLPVWALVMLAGGVLSVSFEAPQAMRTIDEVNV